MGQGQSCDNLYQAALYRYYKNHTAKYGGSSDEMSIAGGSEIAGGLVYTGGYSALEHYGNSVFSKAKEDLIRKLARSGMSVIGIKSPETAPIDQIISKFKSVIPKPGSGKKIHPASANQEKICRSMAKAINNAYGIDLIDEEADVGIICNKVAEVLYSLFTGLHSEFLSVAGDVSRSLRNLEVLQGIVDSANKKIMEDMTKSDDSELSAAAENSKKLYERVAEEIKRQHVILANLVNSSIGPTGESLVNILEDSHEFTGLVDDLKTQLGTPYFGDQLSQLLSGISEVAHVAQLVDKSLKEIGMTVSEYKSSKNITELRQNVLDHIIKKKPSSGEMHKLLIAADMIYKNDLAHDDIADYLSKKGGNLFSVDGGASYDYSSEYQTSYADMVSDKMSFDQINTPFDGRIESKRRSISKQIKDQQKYRRALFASLLSDFKVKYEKIMYSLNNLAKKIGTDDLDYSTTLELFIRQLAIFRNSHPDRQNMHVALSGFRKDLSSVYTKYEFLNNLMGIADTCRELSKGKSSELYKGVANSIDELIEMVDKFNDNYVKTMTEVHVTMERPKKGGNMENDLETDIGNNNKDNNEANNEANNEDNNEANNEDNNEANNKDNNDILGGNINRSDNEINKSSENSNNQESNNAVDQLFEQNINDIKEMSGGMKDSDFRYIVTMAKIIREIEYKYKIHHIKRNLSMSAELNKEVSENYENILGEEAGFMIDKINEKYKNLSESVDKTTFPSGINAQTLYAHGLNLGVLDTSRYNQTLKSNIDVVKLNIVDNEKKKELDSIVSGYKFLLEYIRSAKVELIEASQALDLYLSKFIQDIESNPDTIKDFLQVLEQIEVVAKWFTDKSGNDLAYVFEAFTCYQGTDKSGIIGLDATDANYPNINLVNDVDALTLFKSRMNFDGTIPFDRRTDLSNSNPTYLNAHHYYKDLKDHANINQANAFIPGRFYLPYLMTFDEAKNFVKLIEKSFKNVRALENIVATFSKVNAKSDSNIKTFMSVGMLFKAFMKYAVASSISVGFNLLDELPVDAGNPSTNIPGNNLRFSNMIVGSSAPDANALFSKMAVGLKFYKDSLKWDGVRFLRLCDPLMTNDNLTESTDRLFEWCLKSMVSKIFIVIGSYNLFHKPSKIDGNSVVLSNHPLRQILGGSITGTGLYGNHIVPKIHSDAVELYLRLPLLVEWYKKVFEFQYGNNQPSAPPVRQNTNMIITIMPDMDGVYGDLLRAMFIEAKSVEDGGYPSEYAEKIISAISNIWVSFKAKKSNCNAMDVILDFIQEINRRYGFMMRQEIGAYWDEHESLYELNNDQEYPDEDRVDYDLLNSEEQYSRRSAPSDKFRKISVIKDLKNKNRKSMDDFAKAIREFRSVVDANLILSSLDPTKLNSANLNPSSLGTDALGQMSLTTMINQIKNKVNQAKSDKEQYQIIYEQLHGIDRFADVDQYRMLLFHETVISPLTIIYYVYLMLNDYNRFMISLNTEELEDIVTKYLAGKLILSGNHGQAGNQNPKPIDGNFNLDNVISDGYIGHYLNLALLERNNAKFKGVNNKFKLNDTDYDEYKDAILKFSDLKKYFNSIPAWYIPVNFMNTTAITVQHILANANFTAPDERVAVVKRFCINKQNLMEDVMRKLMKMGTDLNELTEVNFSGDSQMRYPSVNFNKLEEVCLTLFNEAKHNFNSMNRVMPREIVKKYEDLKIYVDGVEVDNQMSLFYLQENLFERLFKNKFGNGLLDSNNALKHIWNYLTEENPFNYINNNRAMCIQYENGNIVDKSNFNIPNGDIPVNPRKEVNLVGISHISGILPLDQTEYNNDTDKVNILLNEYKFDSYNDVLSKLAFWDVTMLQNKVIESLGLRTIVKQQQDLASFPAKFIPIFKSGGTLSQQSNIKQERELAYSIYVSDILAQTSPELAKLNLFDNTIAVLAERKQGIVGASPSEYELILGAHNLYDWNDHLSSSSEVKLDNLNIAQAGISKETTDKSRINNTNEQLGSRLGMIPKFNNLLYKYCSIFMDSSSKKIYKPLLESFVQGYNAKDILQGKNINDRVICNNDFKAVPLIPGSTNLDLTAGNNPQDRASAVCQLEPPEQAIIFASLASAVKNLLTLSVDRGIGSNLLLHAEDNFANISEYQKELMRAYLPIFEKELSILIKRADFLRTIMESTKCKVYKWKKHRLSNNGRLFAVNGTLEPANLLYNTGSNSSYTQPMRLPIVETESSRKSYLIGICDDISTSIKAFLKCINVVQKELADVPLYFETYKDSIVDYNSRNGRLPFMPLSSLTHLLNISSHRYDRTTNKKVSEINNDENNVMYKLDIIPSVGVGVGSTEFKFAYGTRGILCKQPIKVDYIPGMINIFELHMSGIKRSGGAIDFNKNQMNNLIEGSVLLNRWLTDLIYHHTVLDANDYHNLRKLTYDAQLPPAVHGGLILPFTRPTVGLTCQTGKINVRETEFWSRDENVILSMESDNFKQVLYRMTACLFGGQNRLFSSDRDNIRIYNILDLNVVPIDFHALQKEIPFTNLMNHEFTFRHMIARAIGVNTKTMSIKDIHGYEPGRAPGGIDWNEFTELESNKSHHPEDILVRYLIFPTGFRRVVEYINQTYRIMAGNTSLSLNKPKFLSDQLWNKVLVNNLYDNRFDNVVTTFNNDNYRDLNEANRLTSIRPIDNTQVNYYNVRFKKINYGNNLVTNDTSELISVGINVRRDMIVVDHANEYRQYSILNALTYIKMENNKPILKTIQTGAALTDDRLQFMGTEGFLRYQSKIVRWHEWFVQLQRVLRLLMRQQLEWVQDPVVQGHDAISEEVTEFNNNRTFTIEDYE